MLQNCDERVKGAPLDGKIFLTSSFAEIFKPC